MILVLMILAVLSLLFAIATAVRAITASNHLSRKDERTSLIISHSKEADAVELSPYSALLTYELRPSRFFKCFLFDSKNALSDPSASSFKAFPNFQAPYLSNPEIKLESLIWTSCTDKLKVFAQSLEDVKSECIYKSHFFIEVKVIQDKNFEKDDAEVYSDICHYGNKTGGIRYGKY